MVKVYTRLVWTHLADGVVRAKAGEVLEHTDEISAQTSLARLGTRRTRIIPERRRETASPAQACPREEMAVFGVQARRDYLSTRGLARVGARDISFGTFLATKTTYVLVFREGLMVLGKQRPLSGS